jgi:hypothetical protein
MCSIRPFQKKHFPPKTSFVDAFSRFSQLYGAGHFWRFSFRAERRNIPDQQNYLSVEDWRAMAASLLGT